jgi:hypothetical protein
MTCYWVLTLLLVAADDAKRSEIDQDRARRAAIVDRIMGDPSPPEFRRNQTFTTELVAVNEAERKAAERNDGDEQKNDRLIRKPPVEEALMVVLERQNFDRWVFGNMNNDKSRRAWLEYKLRLKAEQAEGVTALSRPQVEKLVLAGRGDIKRFLDRVEEMRPEFDAVRADMAAGRSFLLDDLRPLGVDFQNGPFGNDSLFAKTLKKIQNDALATRLDGK